MAYVKNQDPWADADTLTAGIMDNFETIYTEAASYLASHTHDALYQTKAEMEAAYWYAATDGTGGGSDADLIYKSTGNLHASAFAGAGVPSGLVVLWYGTTANIPAGWLLCDGTNGTINLTDKFVIGAGTGSSYDVGDVGGSNTFTPAGTITVATHVLTTAEMGSHRHPFIDKYSGPLSSVSPGGRLSTNLSTTSGNTPSTGSATAHGHSSAEGTAFTGTAADNMPYTWALCYIQKV